LELLEQHRSDGEARRARRAAALEQAARFSWSAHVDRLVAIYRAVLAADRPAGPTARGSVAATRTVI
jgi:glycosyltransferase involved in cell wall biosynthesis